MIQKLQCEIEPYNAYVLAYPNISNTILSRDEFVSDTGNVFYSELQAESSEIEFSIEFKGTDDDIRRNRARVSAMLELATITFDEEVYYKGRFLEEGIEKRYYFETVTYKGNAIACLPTQEYEVKRNEATTLYNNGDLRTPVRVILEGQGSDIRITGFDSTIEVQDLKDRLVIDSENGLSDPRGLNNVKLFAFPYLNKTADIRVYGTGSFKCFIEFEGRVIC